MCEFTREICKTTNIYFLLFANFELAFFSVLESLMHTFFGVKHKGDFVFLRHGGILLFKVEQ